MTRTRRVRRWALGVAAAAALMAAGGLAHAAIPDAGGVIHSCYTKSSGAWRVIDTGAGQACKSNELPLDVYSKGGAEALFLDQPEADALYHGKTAQAADSDKLDGLDSLHYLKGFDSRVVADFVRYADGATGTPALGHRAEGTYPGLLFDLTCDASGTTTLVARSQERFTWWWDETSGVTAGAAPPYTQTFQLGLGVESHSFRAVFTSAWYTTTLELDSAIGDEVCTLGWTLLKAPNDSPGGP